MNRVLAVCIFVACVVMVSSDSVTGRNYNGMNFYKQADLQCLTHPDLFSKFTCRCAEEEPVVVDSPTDVTPVVDPGPQDRDPDPDPLEWKPLPAKAVYFDYDKSLLKPEGKAAIQRNVEFLKENSNARILIEGNCDERGTNEYNMALGERRAQAVMKYMTDLDIAASRITTKSWGEERPVALGHNESSWWQNRRGDMFFSEE